LPFPNIHFQISVLSLVHHRASNTKNAIKAKQFEQQQRQLETAGQGEQAAAATSSSTPVSSTASTETGPAGGLRAEGGHVGAAERQQPAHHHQQVFLNFKRFICPKQYDTNCG
jgi:hypothetical protein